MPRTVPFLVESDTLCCGKIVSRPRAPNSRAQKVRAKNPRSSRNGSISMSQASWNFVA